MNHYEIVKKLIGPVRAVGETHTDEARFENLKALTELVDRLVFDIGEVALDAGRPEFSVNRAGQHAEEFLQELSNSLPE